MTGRLRRVRDRIAEWDRERRLRYLGYGGQLRALARRPTASYELFDFDEVRQRRRSDTVFVLGSGPSIRDVTPDQWAYVARHDSFGINFSFLLDHVPTYHVLEDGKAPWHRELTRRVLAPRRGKLAPSIWFITNRHTRRLIHPRYTPFLFPEPARVCVITMPPRVLLEADRPFTAADFARSLRYRGTMSLALDIADRLGYRQIVLLGVDFHTPCHFFQDMEEMRPYREHVSPDQLDPQGTFPMMEPKAGLPRPLDEYLAALQALHFSPHGRELSVGDPRCVLAARLPVFWGWDV